ncbi:mannose-1-phosphate guanylyltransferase/mannose-6-phosphate isomerase [Thalassotalea fonticola]|uniref:mannose-1-phosphate guanylyltransferase n=1 Tax=Thalassotalea fonticola TaxID=3065649 RepID=A0ABZ0GTD3_9GAMM|nr:mannose-1-phosphate guanylyltransferase/mannose-6-phosphate isomerase [Colwelliaceae bacterium S1-1]
MIKPVIMAGGSGTRLWPLSRTLYPKQFLKINSDHSMIQNTVTRLAGLDVSLPVTICGEEHRFVVAEQLRAIDKLGCILLEPVGRNTAPAIALAALNELDKGKDPILLVLAADHQIGDTARFQQVVNSAVIFAEQGQLVTFGIVPSHAETGYGYIRKGVGIADGFKVAKFVEKPDEATAQGYLASGEYLWNSGMFMFKASRYVAALEKCRPDILQSCKQALVDTQADLDFVRIDKQSFVDCPAESIDYAVMEPLCNAEGSDSVVVVPLDANWSDIGSFSAIWDVSAKDSNNNVHKGDVLSHNSANNLILAENTLVTTVGIENTIVIQTKDAILVAAKDKVQEVKNIVEQLKRANRPEANLHRQVYRPWGRYDGLDEGELYQVKHIIVNPGEKLSIQMHHHRAEHWIVVSGVALVTNGDKTFLLTENQSTYIPIGTVHALENPGLNPIHLIEVQTGSYLGEDDIVRLEDRYGRIKE